MTQERQNERHTAESRARELALMRGLAAGDDNAADMLLATYETLLFSFIWRRLNPARADAEELLQECFLAAIRAAGSYDGKASLYSWLCGIAKHKVSDYYRRKGRQPVTVPTPFDDGDDTGQTGDFTDEIALRDMVDLAMHELPERYRDLLADKYVKQMTAQEMAAERGVSLKAVESALARARSAFADIWQRLGGK